jgi:AcrR family transcriptional regulator
MQSRKTRSYKSGIRRKQAQATMERIADAADALMKSQGYEKTSINAIAAEAGVSTQTVYAVFGSKQRLLIYLMSRKMDNDYAGYKQEMCAELSVENMAERFAQLACFLNRRQHMDLSAFGGLGPVYPELKCLVDRHYHMRGILFEEYLGRLDERERAELFAPGAGGRRRLELIAALTDGGFYHKLIERAGWPPALFERVLTRLLNEAVKIADLE